MFSINACLINNHQISVATNTYIFFFMYPWVSYKLALASFWLQLAVWSTLTFNFEAYVGEAMATWRELFSAVKVTKEGVLTAHTHIWESVSIMPTNITLPRITHMIKSRVKKWTGTHSAHGDRRVWFFLLSIECYHICGNII